jgi:hypothetical protein
MRTHAEVIKALGGHRKVARALAIEAPNTVLHWGRPGRRIPARYWLDVASLSASAGVGVTIEQLAAMPPNPIREEAA